MDQAPINRAFYRLENVLPGGAEDRGHVVPTQLLLQIDSDEKGLGTMWGDAGRVYYGIRQQDLQKRDFSNVWLILRCY